MYKFPTLQPQLGFINVNILKVIPTFHIKTSVQFSIFIIDTLQGKI